MEMEVRCSTNCPRGFYELGKDMRLSTLLPVTMEPVRSNIQDQAAAAPDPSCRFHPLDGTSKQRPPDSSADSVRRF
ncbi:carboxyl-terminal-processing peptidase 1, chloroplastic-like isoform X2 [Iris pallida]|uniref:Carboxyl-terminal-processing peptidase 1, chloroplastic-like isoform X2 n=1 Tax=Iris pallida TaxID=29817 RepID=A0AAX6IJ95_IRIPA|nr:carboxyl-terminal-processing peptidase 1, chloroplastic-like isoform X2 [Iris pallida]